MKQLLLQIVSGDGVKVMHIATDMGLPIDKMIKTSDIVEAALLPLKMSANALPVELIVTAPGF